MSFSQKFAVKDGDVTVRSTTKFRDLEDMVYMGIIRVKAQEGTNQLRISLAQLESVLATFKDACPEEVRGSVALMICASDGGWQTPQNTYEVAINGYRSPSPAEITGRAQEQADASRQKHLMGMDYERATYERLKEKFG